VKVYPAFDQWGKIYGAIADERRRQCYMWGKQWEPGEIDPLFKLSILTEEIGEIAKELLEGGLRESPHLAEELVQVAAVSVAWLESMNYGAKREEDEATH
jgi:NTP pyrophosphatase (non-canonical NTP hydrolase)